MDAGFRFSKVPTTYVMRDTIKCTVCAITLPFVLNPQHVIKPHYSLTPKLGESNRELRSIFHLGTAVNVY